MTTDKTPPGKTYEFKKGVNVDAFDVYGDLLHDFCLLGDDYTYSHKEDEIEILKSFSITVNIKYHE